MPTHTAEEHPWVGRVVGGRFRVTRVLGEGGMGVVYEGEQHMGSTVRKVAIKTLHPHLSKDPSVLARFHRECGTVAQLEHANTIKVYDFGAEADGTLYIAMEFVSGVSLEKVIEQDVSLAPDRTVNIMRQVCGALDEAHALGIIHRDLKPENVVLTERLGQKDFVKVLDFGIASRSESADAAKEQKLTQQGMVLGTPPYMSPEQFTGQALDRRSDIYSLGIMAYQMLTGRLPFSAQTPWQWATEHMTAQPFPLEQVPQAANVSPAMRAAVMRSLSKDPNKRQATAGQFLEELAAGAQADLRSRPSGTEAMPAAAMGSARTEAMPASPAAVRPPVQPAQTPGAMAAPAVPAAPLREEKSSNKGLVFGLVGVGVVLLGAMAIVATRSGGDDTPTPAGLGTELGGPASGKVEAEKDSQTPGPTPTAEPTVEATGAPTSTYKPPATGGSTKPGTGGTGGGKPGPSASGSSSATPSPSTSAPTTPSGGTCDACTSAVKGGNLQGAASAYASCSPEGRSACSMAARKVAPSLVSKAAKGGDCNQAKAIAAAAKAMGASSGGVTKALESCK